MGRRRAAGGTALDGVLVVDKPAGPTSHDVVGLVRRLSGVHRVGHGGTLDPFASGVLPVFLGHATRVVEYHMADEKAYRAVVAFGASSTTDDLEGELTPGEGGLPSRDVVEAALESFRGPIEQVPPAHSAVKVGGRKAYELARHGETVELKARSVRILALGLVDWSDDPERPTATLEVRCTAGTYIRALARDLGAALGCGAYLVALTRTASGPFRIEDAHSLERLRAALADGRVQELLLPPDVGLDAMPRLMLDEGSLAIIARGQPLRLRGVEMPQPGPDGRYRLADEGGRLAAIARLDGGRLQPEKVFVAPAP
ncbi:MAG TPA: tRNA pseudouridine(55) synthase TruB [Candidatus Limnocylindrales bacterium]|nr:tRNA pseudouridine(55) synthase TruB [Candidatus Limnocylindrales bacterium]